MGSRYWSAMPRPLVPCPSCQKPFQPVNKGRGRFTKTCSAACRDIRVKIPQGVCETCGDPFSARYRSKRFCSPKCYIHLPKPEHVERMTVQNPMSDLGVRGRMRHSLQLRGDPFVGGGRGGNGRELTKPQLAVLKVFPTLIAEYPIPTGVLPDGRSKFWLVDCADPIRKVVIEVDGASHKRLAQKARDVEKDTALQRIGWTVLRVTNAEALQENILLYKVRVCCPSLYQARATISQMAS